MKDFFTEGTQTASGKILPFSLWLTVGQGEKAKKIGISHLAEDASNFAGNRVLILECNPYVIGSEIFDISGCGNTKGKRDH